MEVHQATGNAKVMLERTLKEALKGKKILLVMDDVWNHRAWEGVLKTPLVNCLAPGSRVLLTTRDDKVARVMKAEEPYHQVHKLEPEDAWCLLKKQVVRNVSDEPEIDMLKDVGMGIIEKCDCLPLAVKVMGGLLCQKKRRRDASSYARKAGINGKLHLRHLNLNCSTRQGDDAISEEEQRRIEGVFDELCPPPCLEILAIIGYFGSRLPRWMMSIASGLPRSIRTLLMNDLACCTELPGDLCQLPFLEEVRIRSAPAIKRVGPTFLQPYHHGDGHAPQPQVVTSFPRLLKLRFGGMLVWEEWEWEEQVQAMPNLEMLTLERCKLRRIPPGLAFQAKSLRLLCVHNVKHLSSLENLSSVVQLHVLQCHDLERIENLWKLQKLRINTCPKMKVLKGVPALERLGLEDYTMKTLPGYLQDVKPRHFELEDCTLLLLTAIAAGRSGPEWDKFGHIQHVKAYAAEDCIPRKRFVLYTRDPFSFPTNASSSDIARVLLYTKTCTIEDECLVGGQYANENKCQPLCLRFRWNSYRHLSSWLSQVCLHCKDAACVVSSSGPE